MVLDLELSVPEVKVHESLHFSELLWQHNAAVHVPGIQVCLDKGTMKEMHHPGPVLKDIWGFCPASLPNSIFPNP